MIFISLFFNLKIKIKIIEFILLLSIIFLIIIKLRQFFTDSLDNFTSVLEFHFEMHNFVDILKLSLVSESFFSKKLFDLFFIIFSILIILLKLDIKFTFNFFLKNSRISSKYLGTTTLHYSILICINLLI